MRKTKDDCIISCQSSEKVAFGQICSTADEALPLHSFYLPAHPPSRPPRAPHTTPPHRSHRIRGHPSHPATGIQHSNHGRCVGIAEEQREEEGQALRLLGGEVYHAAKKFSLLSLSLLPPTLRPGGTHWDRGMARRAGRGAVSMRLAAPESMRPGQSELTPPGVPSSFFVCLSASPRRSHSATHPFPRR